MAGTSPSLTVHIICTYNWPHLYLHPLNFYVFSDQFCCDTNERKIDTILS